MRRGNEGRAKRAGALRVPATSLTPTVAGERTLQRLAELLERVPAELDRVAEFHRGWASDSLPTSSVGDSADTTIHTPMIGHIGSSGHLSGEGRPDFNSLWDYAGPRESVAVASPSGAISGGRGRRTGGGRRSGGGGRDGATSGIEERAEAIEDLADALGELREEFEKLLEGDALKAVQELSKDVSESVEEVGEAARMALDPVSEGYAKLADGLGQGAAGVHELNGAIGVMLGGVTSGAEQVSGILGGVSDWMGRSAGQAGASWAAVFDGLTERLDQEVFPRLQRALAMIAMINSEEYDVSEATGLAPGDGRNKEIQRGLEGARVGDGREATYVYVDGRRLARSVEETSGERSVEVSSF